jgi:hypothetical protein
VNAFVHNAAAFVDESRRAGGPRAQSAAALWLALAEPGLDTMLASVQKVPRP